MPKLKCTKHGEQFFYLGLNVQADEVPPQMPTIPKLCYACFLDLMVRSGVCALFPAEEVEKAEEWPTDLEERKS